MKNYFITFLSFCIILIIILNISLNQSFSQIYVNLDGKVIPLLIPPYKTIKDENNTSPHISNVTFISNNQLWNIK